MEGKNVTFKVGDKVISREDSNEGTISRLCGDSNAVFVKWDDSPTQQRMVEIKSLGIKPQKTTEV